MSKWISKKENGKVRHIPIDSKDNKMENKVPIDKIKPKEKIKEVWKRGSNKREFARHAIQNGIPTDIYDDGDDEAPLLAKSTFDLPETIKRVQAVYELQNNGRYKLVTVRVFKDW